MSGSAVQQPSLRAWPLEGQQQDTVPRCRVTQVLSAELRRQRRLELPDAQTVDDLYLDRQFDAGMAAGERYVRLLLLFSRIASTAASPLSPKSSKR